MKCESCQEEQRWKKGVHCVIGWYALSIDKKSNVYLCNKCGVNTNYEVLDSYCFTHDEVIW